MEPSEDERISSNVKEKKTGENRNERLNICRYESRHLEE
jgi:hypothetical protein